ncbi:MAG TPA: hypothetical protein VFO38_00925 [Candidatus Saccharimonadales bacterium]|nr:hypothetical protein [Candidatus Saccharimonadales bacterium]
MGEVRVGVVGYCPPTKFDAHEAQQLIVAAFNAVELRHPGVAIAVVSGLADLGVPGLAYAEATKRGWRTVGVVCRRRAEKYPLFPVNEARIIDNESEESVEFLGYITELLKFGGGAQSLREAEMAETMGKAVFRYELLAL